jgi:outer membrane protein assembly factor BamB
MAREHLCRWVRIALLAVGVSMAAEAVAADGWLSWRGPEQTGVSRETGLPDRIASPNDALWVADWGGQSTAVVMGDRLYINGFRGEGPDLQEGLACIDAETGKILWTRTYNDFLSDTIYSRYSSSSPVIDPETGNVYMQGTQGILAGFTPDGAQLWRISMMEKYGRMTFPNGRTASPIIDGDLVITRGITSNWGAHGAPGDRFYAFDKLTGDLVWSSSPGGRPKDNSYSSPYLTWFKGKRVLIATCGDGSVVCVNARTGDPIWQIPLAKAGINATVLVHNEDKIVAIYGTPYEPGQLVALRMPNVEPEPGKPGPVIVEREALEIWSDPSISTSTSSPILVGDRIYVTKEKGDLVAVDVNTGKVFWSHQLGIEQRNACPLYADGKIYAPILDDPSGKGGGEESGAGMKGGFYILKDNGDSVEELTHIALEGRCFGSPTAYDGKVYIQTTQKLYAFGRKGNAAGARRAAGAAQAKTEAPKPGPAAQLQIIPSEVLVHPGESVKFRARKLDANGLFVADVPDVSKIQWSAYVPPTALVKARMDASFNEKGELVVAKDAEISAGAFEATLDGLKGYIRGRILPAIPFHEDFESFTLSNTTTNTVEPPTPFAYPPLPWIGARFRFEVREIDGTKALTKTIENKLLQRATTFIGDARMKNYTIQANVRSEGSRRKMSEVGVVNQRYVVVLKGNSQELEVNSTQERLRVATPFRWQPNVWYTLKARVDVSEDGTGVVRAKAWKKGDPEPSAWTIEVPHKTAHQEGSPGLFAFSPQDMKVYIDDVQVTPN